MNKSQLKKDLIKLIDSHTSIINPSHSFHQYIAKCQRNQLNNEENIVQPFALNFLELLNYVNQHNLVIEEEEKGNKPDFHSNSFVFECKSSKYKDFSEKIGRLESPQEQLVRYLKSKEFSREYGILFSFDRIEIYKLLKDENLKLIEGLTFSLVELYEGKSTNFENFISKFYVSPLSIDDKIETIANIEKTDLIPIKTKIFNKILKSLINDISLELTSQFITLSETSDNKKLMRQKVCQIKKQMDLPLTKDAEIEFISQMSYIILARILLTKCWEDFGLIEPPNTYNGGFKKYIQDIQEKIEDVYKLALNKSQDIYYLFNPDNPYLLLKLSDKMIVDILFKICKYDFNTLDYDILGYIYEDYLDLEHRKKFGQYYTPPYIVNLILDRVDYKPLSNEYLNSTILDPASGSGTFLLNAVRRILNSKKDGQDNSSAYKRLIENCVYGSELMLFPYLLSEINVLIQISYQLKMIIKKKEQLNVFHIFPNNSFNLLDKTIITRISDIPEEKIKGNDIIDSAIIDRKKDKLLSLQRKVDFDFIVGNPPYVANNRNPELFREMQELFTFCSTTYYNKMDLFYWFIILGILKLRSGGKLCYITTRYWIDKGALTGVETLKRYILEYCYFREVIDLRAVNIFVSAPGQENIIFVLEKKSNNSEDNFIKVFKIQPRPLRGECDLDNCPFERTYCINDQEYLECLCKREREWDSILTNPNIPLSNYIHVYYSARQTSDLNYNRSWDIFLPGEGEITDAINSFTLSCTNVIERTDVGGQVYTQSVVKHIKDFYEIRVGILTTSDEIFVLTSELLKIKQQNYFIKLDSTINIRHSEKQALINMYEGEIDSEGYVWLKITENGKNRLFNLYKTPSVYKHGLDTSKISVKLIFFEDERDYFNCPVLIKYLSQYKEQIEDTLGSFSQSELNPARPNKWITLRRGGIIKLNGRNRNLYNYYNAQPKIFYNYRVGNNNIFGFTDKQMCATTDMYFFHESGEQINLYYILAYLNSKVMTFYFKERPIELQRQKTNVENDIPIFIPRNEHERTLQRFIIKKEKELVKKLQQLEKKYRTKGFHFNLDQIDPEDIGIDIQKVLENVELQTIDEISYKSISSTDFNEIDRTIFPIIINNSRNIESLNHFNEQVEDLNVIFIDRSLSIIVSKNYYERFKFVLDSYFGFNKEPNLHELLNLKVPNNEAMKYIKIRSEMLIDLISQISASDKSFIENLIDRILKGDYEISQISQTIKNINSINKMLYFIDLAFIKMIMPKYLDLVLNY